jgi:TonB family protein
VRGRGGVSLVVVIVVALAGGGRVAFAQADGGAPADAGLEAPPAVDAGVADGGADDVALPPVLLAPVVADYPPAARAAGLAGSVVVKVDVDVEGRVTAASVVRAAGNGFDEAARAAALRARFRPARRGGRTVASRIALLVDFRLPPPPPPPVAPRPPEPPRRRLPGALAPLDVTVRGESAVDRKRHSAEAVTIVDMERAKREAADMGQVLARTEGVTVRQAGGLGSYTRISLNGLIDDQVRYFLDGLPLELAGYPFGITNVPVNLVERVEIYKGVLPIRFAADALGGAFNLVSDQDLRGSRVSASYKAGSFDTHRLTLNARHLHEPTGFFVRASGFFDYSRNDYRVDVDAPDAEGQIVHAQIHRYHDKYRAMGANVETGFVDRSWARRLILRAFVTDYDKDFQHNLVMTVPYGGVTYGETMTGVSLRYEQTWGRLTLEVLGAYAYLRGRYQDVSPCVWDWYGRCVRLRRNPGEVDGEPHDEVFFNHRDYLRTYLSWRASARQAVRVALMPPRFATTKGDDRYDPPASDELNSFRVLVTMVNGAEHQIDLVEGRLENIAFIKQYMQLLDADEVGGTVKERSRSTFRFGVGDGVRYRVGEGLWLKASYEWATRLPRPGEVFGDNAFTQPNLELKPETSHNGNLGFQLDRRGTRLGAVNLHVNGFARLLDNYIVLISGERTSVYRNVFAARGFGLEGKAGWTSPRNLLVLEGTFSWTDIRNASSQGTFGQYEGDRITARPWLEGWGSARLQLQEVMAALDELSLYWNTRYVHSYFRGWESIGLREFKYYVPTQIVHTIGAAYFTHTGTTRLSMDLEVQNLTDARVYDFYGAQRPGRAVFTKMTAEF